MDRAESMFTTVYLLRMLRKYCTDSNVKNQVLAMQKEHLFQKLKDHSEEQKRVIWEVLIKTGNHQAAEQLARI